MELILPRKQALLMLNTLHFIKKCSSSPTSPEQQNLQNRKDAGVGGEEYRNFSISKWCAEQRNLVRNERWFLDCTISRYGSLENELLKVE